MLVYCIVIGRMSFNSGSTPEATVVARVATVVYQMRREKEPVTKQDGASVYCRIFVARATHFKSMFHQPIDSVHEKNANFRLEGGCWVLRFRLPLFTSYISGPAI